MARDIALLVSPTAGRGRAIAALDTVVRLLRDGGARVSAASGRDAAEARRIAVELARARPDAFLALGGDGTVHLALQAVAGSSIPLGIIPAGTGNDIARAVGLPLHDIAAAVDLVLAGRTRRIDAVRWCAAAGGDAWYAGVLAAGFDSRVNERANRMRHAPRPLRYLAAVAAELRTLHPLPFVVDLDGTSHRVEALLVAVANVASYGGGMRVCPQAKPDDGLLDVLIVEPLSRREFLAVFPRVYRGTHLSHPAVRLHRARSVCLQAAGVVAYADGERLAPLPLTCTTAPGSLRIVVP